MPATITPEVGSGLARDKSYGAAADGRRGGKPAAVFLLVAIFLLLVAGLWRSLTQKRVADDKAKVVAAGADVPAGCRLGYTSLHYVEIPNRYVTPDMVASYPQVVGSVTKTYIPAGEPIKRSWLLPGGKGLSFSLGNDQRAITLKLPEEALVGFAMEPGDKVDVLATVTKDGKKYTRTICQQATVLLTVARDARLSPKLRSAEQNTVTLAVSPDQAEKITEGCEVGKLRLVLRNRLGTGLANLPGVSERDLLPADALLAKVVEPALAEAPQALPLPPPPQASAIPSAQPVVGPAQWLVEVFSGSKKEVYAFPERQK